MTDVVVLGIDEHELLSLVAAAERESEHPVALRIGRGTLRKMRQNLGWAIGNNVLALPLVEVPHTSSAVGHLAHRLGCRPTWRHRPTAIPLVERERLDVLEADLGGRTVATWAFDGTVPGP